MTGPADELRAAVAARAEGTPYVVVPTPEGFDLRIDLADARWWGPLGAAGRRKVVQHRVALDEGARSMTITDDHYDVQWSAGADVSTRVPRLVASARAERSLGRTWEVSGEKTFGLDDTGRPATVVDYTFSSAEGHGMIRDAAAPLGWSERMGAAQRAGVVAAVAAGGVAGLVAVVLVVLGATGRL